MASRDELYEDAARTYGPTLGRLARAAGHALSAVHLVRFVGGAVCFLAVLFGGIWLLNRWTASKLQTQIDELDALTADTDQAR